MKKLLILLALALGTLGNHNQATGAALAPGDARGLLAMPLVFEKNAGQADDSALFVSRGGGFAMSVERGGVTLALSKSKPRSHAILAGKLPADDVQSDVFTVSVDGALPNAEFTGEQLAAGKSNYFIGNDPQKWLTEIPQFRQVKASGIYPGIDLVYYGNQRQLEYDFNVSAGADPAKIKLALKNVTNLQISEDGGLIFQVGGGYVRMHKPVAYQPDDTGVRVAVAASYTLDPSGRVSFNLGGYNHAKPLVIDPILAYSSYLGGSGDDEAHGIAVDSTGKIYVTGKTNGSFPTTANVLSTTYRGSLADAFVSKIDPTLGSGGLVWSTYLGGAGFDEGNGVAVDSSFSVYVCGDTTSTNFPKTYQPVTGANYDAFITKLNSTGSAVTYSAKLGGSANDYGSGIAVDSNNRAYMVGLTYSTNFPLGSAPIQNMNLGNGDAFVLKLATAGNSLVYSTYLGGGGRDEGLGITVDAVGRSYITGDTTSVNFPVQNAAGVQPVISGATTEAFVSKLTIDGAALLFSSYLGGSVAVSGGDATDVGVAVAVDTSQSIYLAGYTSAANFPRVSPIQSTHGGGEFDGFLTKIKSDLSGIAYSTYLGGDGDDEVLALALDANRNAYAAGETLSSNFPAINAFQDTSGGGGDAFISKINAGGSAIVYSSYLGGAPTTSSLTGSDVAYGVAVGGPNGNTAYVTGYTLSNSFPTSAPYQLSFGGTRDAFVSTVVPTFGINRDDTFTTGGIAPTGSSTGWSVIGVNTPGIAYPSYDPVNTAYRCNVSTSTAPRYSGVFTNVNESMPYSAVGTDHYVRVKYYVYAGGQAVPSQLNTIPNFRVRAANRFAVSAILNVSHHLGNIPNDQIYDQELRPTTDPTNPSLYRVDFDPVDVPYLISHAGTDTILRSFEAACLEPQENGYIAMTESVIGTYPISATPDSVPPAKTYAPTLADAGNLKVTQSADLAIVKYIPGDPLVETTSAPLPLYSEGAFGVTLDTASIETDRIGIVSREFNPGSDPTSAFYLRVEEAKQYKVRFHLTSTQMSNRNAEVRMRARTIRFGWSQSLEIGGAWAIGTNGASGNAAVAGQALPGIGCLNPDKDGSENGGYYTLILTSPMSIDIRPEVLGTLSARMPNISGQPGPQQAGTSIRDLRVALDLIDTYSPGVNAPLEAGNVTLDKIEIRKYPLVDD